MSTVLIADDQSAVRELVRATVESDGCTILEAVNGSEAWELIRRYRPDVAILDIQMPGRDGLDLVRAIKADSSLATIRTILLTVQMDSDDRVAGLAAGADMYLTKPFSPRELLAAVEQALQGA